MKNSNYNFKIKFLLQKIFSKKGTSQLSIIVAVFVTATLTANYLYLSSNQELENRIYQTADHFNRVMNKVSLFLEEDRCFKGILQGIEGGQITENNNILDTALTIVDGTAGICNNINLNEFEINETNIDTFNFISPINAFNQKYYGSVRKSAADKPLLIIYTKERHDNSYTDSFIRKTVRITANTIGSYAGYIPETSAEDGTSENIAKGAFNGWTYNLTLAGITDIPKGNLIGIKTLGEYALADIDDSHLLYRKQPDDDPTDYLELGYNQMEWDLDMTNNEINHVKSLGFEIQNSPLDCSLEENDGKMFYIEHASTQKELYICIEKEARQIHTSANSMQIKEIYFGSANASPADYITPPTCIQADGTMVEATAFISPTVTSSGEGESPTAAGDSIITTKVWIEKINSQWRPRMEVLTITGKKIQPVGPHSKVLVMAICPKN